MRKITIVTVMLAVLGFSAGAQVNIPSTKVTSNGNVPSSQSPASIPARASVPEASTILAGVLMMIPFSIGAFRAIRKDRGPK